MRGNLKYSEVAEWCDFFSCKCVLILPYLFSACLCSWMINIMLQWIFLVFACNPSSLLKKIMENVQGHFWFIVVNDLKLCILFPWSVIFNYLYYIVWQAHFFYFLSVIVATICVCLTWREITIFYFDKLPKCAWSYIIIMQGLFIYFNNA